MERYRALNLMIVGVYNSGKTSLMKRLTHKKNIPEDEINIDEWRFSTKTHNCKTYFKLWDFPSQVCMNYVIFFDKGYFFNIGEL